MIRALFLVAFGVLVCSNNARAYTLRSGLTDSCHEKMTVEAFASVLDDMTEDVETAPGGAWDEIATALFGDLIFDDEVVAAGVRDDRVVRFVLFSLVAGIRAPDTEGHAPGNVAALRSIHLDGSPTRQYAHALRAPLDDGMLGDVSAVAGTRELIRDLVERAAAARRKSFREQLIEVDFFLEFYGKVEITVLEPSYLLGRALHALQDSHSHMLRSDDGTEVYHVLNFVDAIRGELTPEVDGMAHSDAMDECEGPVEPLVERATARTAALVEASRVLAAGDPSLLDRGLSRCPEGELGRDDCGWIEYQAGCGAKDDDPDAPTCCQIENDFCGARWLSIVEKKPTKPYASKLFSCSLHPTPTRTSDPSLWALGFFVVLLATRRGFIVSAFVLVSCLASSPAVADSLHRAFASAETHGSLASGDMERAAVSPSFGYGVRGGYRYDRFGALLHIERNYWVSTQTDLAVVAGVLNVGAGAEILFADSRLRSSAVLGASILRYDAVLDEAGTTGWFLDVRPVGIRFPWGRYVDFVIDPISLTVIRPATQEPVLQQAQFRTVLAIEGHAP